jgi:hypothetical protein
MHIKKYGTKGQYFFARGLKEWQDERVLETNIHDAIELATKKAANPIPWWLKEFP